MAKKKQTLTKTQQKQIKKFARKNPKIFLILLVAILVIGGIGVGAYLFYKKNYDGHHHDPIESGEVQINFLELGNDRIGDSTFIKVGDIDILIDAGSRKNSTEAIENFMKTKMDDKKLEYVIATHAHEDHIAGFVGTSSYGGIFDHYKVDNLIQFSRTDSTSTLYKDYSAKVDVLKNNGCKVFTADQLVGQPITLGENITLEILDQKYYREKASTENNYSVCCLLTQGENHYLFTGDLEGAGERSLVEKNHLPECELFKGGHHGSDTSNTDDLLQVIKPKTVCICTCVGSKEYTENPAKIFPAQVVCDTIHKYTDKVYVTGSYIDEVYAPMNGNITFICKKGSDYEVHGSNNDTILKETNWFKNNRT